MVLAGLIAAQKLLGGKLAEHTYLFLGAGEVTFFVLLYFIIYSYYSLYLDNCKVFLVRRMKEEYEKGSQK